MIHSYSVYNTGIALVILSLAVVGMVIYQVPVRVVFKESIGMSGGEAVVMFGRSVVEDALAVVVSSGVPIGDGTELSCVVVSTEISFVIVVSILNPVVVFVLLGVVILIIFIVTESTVEAGVVALVVLVVLKLGKFVFTDVVWVKNGVIGAVECGVVNCGLSVDSGLASAGVEGEEIGSEVGEVFEAEEVEVPGTVSVLAGKEKAVVVLVSILELPVTEVTSDIIVPV